MSKKNESVEVVKMTDEELLEQIGSELPSFEGKDADQVYDEYIKPLVFKINAICDKMEMNYAFIADSESTIYTSGRCRADVGDLLILVSKILQAHMNDDYALLMRLDAETIKHKADLQLYKQMTEGCANE